MATIQPILILVSPWQDPPNTFRAQTIHDMYSIAANPNTFDIVYEVGITPDLFNARHFAFRNNTQSHDLELDLTLPDFWSCDTQLPITVLRNTTITFYLTMLEDVAKVDSQTNVRVYKDEIDFHVTPLLVNGPVYVYQNLPPLTVDP